jgi:hypothetical protein
MFSIVQAIVLVLVRERDLDVASHEHGREMDESSPAHLASTARQLRSVVEKFGPQHRVHQAASD